MQVRTPRAVISEGISYESVKDEFIGPRRTLCQTDLSLQWDVSVSNRNAY